MKDQIIRNYGKHTLNSRINMLNEFLTHSNITPIINTNNEETESYIRPIKKSKKQTTQTVIGKKNENFIEIINRTGAKLTYIKSGSTGHTFKGVVDNENGHNFVYALKVCAYPKCEMYGDYTNIKRPENAEILMLKVLSYFVIKKKTPHLMLPYCTFDTNIKFFTDNKTLEQSATSEQYKKFMKNYKDGKFHDNVSVLLCEWANNGDFLDFIRKHYQKITPIMWKIFFFQILSTLAVIQNKYPGFRHNDLKANNILVQEIKESSSKKNKKRNRVSNYTISGINFKVPKIRYQLKIWDFDFSSIPGVIDNCKVGNGWTKSLNITTEKNRYYDVHYFFITLRLFFKNKNDVFPAEVIEFIDSILPKRLVSGKFIDTVGMKKVKDKKGNVIGTTKGKEIDVCYDGKRLLKNEEFTTPSEIIENNKYFQSFREPIATRDFYTNMSNGAFVIKGNEIPQTDNFSSSDKHIKKQKYKL